VFYNTVTGDVAKVTSTVNVSSFSAGTTGLTPNTATTGAVTLAGTLATTNGGTGLTSFTANGVVYASSSSALATGSALTFDGTTLAVTGALTASTSIRSGTTGASLLISPVSATPSDGMQIINTFFTGSQGPLLFKDGTTTRMTLDPSGNLGLGVTPSAWAGTGVKAFQFQTGSLAASNTFGTMLSWNTIYDGSYKYLGSTVASMYQLGGGHTWYTAPSGTAGNAITFTQAMTLNSYGFLGVGNTSPGYTIDIDGKGNAATVNFNSSISSGTNFKISQGIQGVSNGGMQIYDITNSAVRMAIDSSGNLGIGNSSAVGKLEVYQNNNSGIPAIYARQDGTAPIQTWNVAGGAEKARIDSSGNLLVGTTSAGNRVSLKTTGGGCWLQTEDSVNTSGGNVNLFGSLGTGTAAIYTTGANPIAFYTNGTESARIDTSGNLLVGTTSAGGYKFVVTTTGGNYVANFNTGNGGIGLTIANSASGNQVFQYFYSISSNVGSISTNGTTTSYNVASDYRLKNNQAPLTGSGEFIDALKPKTWNWSQDGSKGVGFIAHEFAEVSPSSVNGTKDAVDAKGNPVYQAMQASSSEVIANLVSEIQSLRKRLADAGIA
jgi:hypothetical protein